MVGGRNAMDEERESAREGEVGGSQGRPGRDGRVKARLGRTAGRAATGTLACVSRASLGRAQEGGAARGEGRAKKRSHWGSRTCAGFLCARGAHERHGAGGQRGGEVGGGMPAARGGLADRRAGRVREWRCVGSGQGWDGGRGQAMGGFGAAMDGDGQRHARAHTLTHARKVPPSGSANARACRPGGRSPAPPRTRPRASPVWRGSLRGGALGLGIPPGLAPVSTHHMRARPRDGALAVRR